MGHLKRCFRLAYVAVLGSMSFGQSGKPNSYIPKEGFVPDSVTALSIAEAVSIPVYGRDQIASEKPLKAVLKGTVRVVTGRVPCNGPPGVPCPGGAAEVQISKRTGAILFMTHYQ